MEWELGLTLAAAWKIMHDIKRKWAGIWKLAWRKTSGNKQAGWAGLVWTWTEQADTCTSSLPLLSRSGLMLSFSFFLLPLPLSHMHLGHSLHTTTCHLIIDSDVLGQGLPLGGWET